MTSTSTPSLRAAFAELRAQGVRARDAAKQLNLSEGQVMAAHAASQMSADEAAASLIVTQPLNGEWISILKGLEPVGEVMALTRNEHIVHEKVGVYSKVSANGPVGLVLSPEIDLRLFLNQWHAGFHVIERSEKGEQHSLQFFDAHGQAVHKVHARPQSSLEALKELAQRHAAPARDVTFQSGSPAPVVDRPDAEIDTQGLGEAWAAMHDTHDFFGLLKRFQVGRLQALRLMEGKFTRPTPLLAVDWLLNEAATSGLSIMAFVGNPGCIQIHTGPVKRIEPMGPWLNVLDASFNLHLRSDAIHSSWLVTKPTDDGDVTSIELFDATGELIVMFFGERKPGKPELQAWRDLAHSLADGTPPSNGRPQQEAA